MDQLADEARLHKIILHRSSRLSASRCLLRVIFVCPGKSFIISSPAEEIVMPDQPTYRSQVLDHLGLVAGMFDELGIGDIIDQATQQNPEMRDLTVGEAVKAMVLNGLGFTNQARYLVPRFFQNKPTYRLISPRVAPEQLKMMRSVAPWIPCMTMG